MLCMNDVGRSVVWNDGSYGLIVSGQVDGKTTKFRIWYGDQTYVFDDKGKPHRQGPIMIQGGLAKLEIIGFGGAQLGMALKVGV